MHATPAPVTRGNPASPPPRPVAGTPTPPTPNGRRERTGPTSAASVSRETHEPLRPPPPLAAGRSEEPDRGAAPSARPQELGAEEGSATRLGGCFLCCNALSARESPLVFC